MLISCVVTAFSHLGPAAYSITAVFLWGAADFAGGFASRRVNAFVFTAFSHVCAFVLMTTVALAQHGPFPDRASILWALAAGAIGGFSLALFYGALASGQMGLTAPISALIGAAIPTLFDIALEGAPKRWTIAGFALAILAIWLITRPEPSSQARNPDGPEAWPLPPSPESDSPASICSFTRRTVRPPGSQPSPVSVRSPRQAPQSL